MCRASVHISSLKFKRTPMAESCHASTRCWRHKAVVVEVKMVVAHDLHHMMNWRLQWLQIQ